MLNQVVLVGRIVKIYEDYIVLKVERPKKNEEGLYDVDYIPIALPNSIMERTREECKENNVIGVKGRLEVHYGAVCIKAEKISYLSSN